MKTPLSDNEATSTEALHQHQIQDIEPEAAFDDLRRLAAQICETPVALVSLVDECRQWFKMQVGMEFFEPKRDVAFCNQTILPSGALIVPDVLTDERFATNPLVTEYPQIRFFAGVPLIATNGHTLGKLCVIDYVPRELSPEQLDALWALSRQAIIQLELRRHLAETVDIRTEPEGKTEQLRLPTERERLVVEIAQRIRQSLSLSSILNTTVSEVRQFLQVERVFIYRFEPDWGGVVVVESVASGWKPILGSKLKDPKFVESYVQPYKKGRIQATADIYAGDLTPCYVDFLAQFQVKAVLVVPILQGELWGLLVANHCSSPREWQQLEIDLLKQLATQVAIAIQQSTLFEQLQTELAERKRVEAKLREQATLLDVTTDAIFVQDHSNQILYWNKGAERLYGWLAEEVLGKNTLHLQSEKSLPQIEGIQKIVAERGSWQGELSQLQKDGLEIIVASRWTLVRDEQGQSKSTLIVNTDITGKIKLEAQFLRAQRVESLGTLASGIAHDLNNVLAPILMSVQLLERKLPDVQSQRLLQIVETSAKRGANLVKQVLSFARGVEGKLMTLQVANLIPDIKAIAMETFPKSIEVLTDVSRHLWTVSGNATQLHQVLINLCVNARDAMPNGGTLLISAENVVLDANYTQYHIDAQLGPYIVMTVADTGTGISKEIINRIFEPFFTTKDLGNGTGLGLSTVIGIVRSHDGFVNVYSEIGQGTQFKVYLPATEEAEAQLAVDLELQIGHDELILIVDDEAPIREATETSLGIYGYKTLTACDGIEAIALYAEHRREISIALIDIMMPFMDGPTTIRTLQKMNPEVKLIAVSGLPSNEQILKTAGLGVKTFLSKPYTVKELLQTLHEVLNS